MGQLDKIESILGIQTCLSFSCCYRYF